MYKKIRPFFSIVIPTRQCHETLPFTIQTVLKQDFDDYELIISDNCSSPETATVVSRFKSKKIKYIRSEIPLAMSDNWELALSKATGEYIIVFGSDDGLVKNALSFLYKIIRETNYEVVRWDRVYYNWNNILISERKNKLTIPIYAKTRVCNSKKMIKKVIGFKEGYTQLPMLYNSAINHNLIEKLKERSGKVFFSITPDVYSGYAFAFLSYYYLSLGIPVTINGGSAKSHGTASLIPSNPISEDFKKLISRSELSFHRKMPFIRSMPAAIIEPFLQLQDALNISDIRVNRKMVMNKVIERLVVYNEKEREESIALIKEACKDDKKLKNFVEKKLKKFQIPITKYSKKPYKIGISDNFLVLDVSKFGINDVFQVSEFVSGFYDYDFSKVIKEINFKKNTLIESLYKRFRSAARILIKGE